MDRERFPSNPREAAEIYETLGWRSFPLEAAKKSPRRGVMWKDHDFAPGDFLGADNVGIVLGTRSGGLVDLDLDINQARLIANELVAVWPGFGRETARGGHRLVRCPDIPDDAKSAIKFGFQGRAAAAAREVFRSAADEKVVVLELRPGPDAYTMFPPSVHPSGERVEWIGDAAPDGLPEVSWESLMATGRCIALLAVVLRLYPSGAGHRDEIAMALAGTLLRLGLRPDQVDTCTQLVARLGGDEEWSDRAKADQTAARIEGGEPSTGLKRLCELLGCETLLNTLAGWLELARDEEQAEAPDGAVILNRYATHEVVHDLERILFRRDNTYRRGAELVRMRRLEEPEIDTDRAGEQSIYRRAGVVEIAPARPGWMVMEVSRSGAVLGIVTPRGFQQVPAKDAMGLLRLLSEVATDTAFPILQGISTTPTLERGEPGYDSKTGLYLAFPHDMFPPVRSEPSKDEAAAALTRLEHPLRKFPFVTEADKSVADAAMLLSVVRGELGPCPLHGYSAPAPGSGKTLLASIVGVVGTGVEPSAITFTPDADEMEKRLATLLRAGDQVILIDNVVHPMKGAFLCAMFTLDEVQARILGLSERMRLPSRVTVLATGNHLTYQGDMTRRGLVCTIDPRVEEPEKRSFDFHPVEEVKARRAEAVADILTVLRAYRAAGCPERLTPLGSFEDYDLIRGALVWLDRDDPASTMANARADDPEQEERGALFRILLAEYAGAPGADPPRFRVRELSPAQQSRLAELLERGFWSPVAVGGLLRRHHDRPFCGVVLRHGTNRSKDSWWWFEIDPSEWEEPWWPRRQGGYDDEPF